MAEILLKMLQSRYRWRFAFRAIFVAQLLESAQGISLGLRNTSQWA
jgi:hypothetical protein